MEKLLIICEKPSAAKNFAKALGGQQGTYNSNTYAIVNLYGHIMELKDPASVAKKEYKSVVGGFSELGGIPWNPSYFDFYAKTVKPKIGDFDGYQVAFNNVKKFLDAGYIPVVASDIDTFCEGDLIVHEVLDALNYTGKRYREYHVDETVNGVQKAMNQLKEVTATDPAYMTGFTRSACDFLTQQYTRMATMKIQEKGYRLPGVVPMGRLKSAAITIVGDQLEAIKVYKPRSVYESRYKLDNLILTSKDVPQYETEEAWKAAEHNLPTEATVKKVKETPGRTAPPKPFDTNDLSGLMARHGYDLKQTEKLAQALYENGDGSGLNYISYPRTEEQFVTTEQFEEILPFTDRYLDLLGLPKAVFTHRTARSTHVKDKGAHGALRPGAIPSSLEELDAKFGKGASLVYKLVTERYLMMFLEDTEWVRHEYETTDTSPVFSGSLKVITKQGVVDPDAEPDDTTSTSLPDLNQKAVLYAHEVKSTKPANPTTEWLLKQLKKHGVGTPATQTKTMSELIGAKPTHPIKSGKVLSLSILGQIGYEAAKGTLIGSVEGTKFMHECIAAVRKGTFTPDEAITKFTEAIIRDMDILRRKDYNLDGLEIPKGPEKVSGTWLGRDVSFKRSYSDHRFTDDEVQRLLNGEPIVIEITTKTGRSKVQGKLADLDYEGRPYVGFKGEFVRDVHRGMWNGQEVAFKKTYGEHTFTADEVTKLLAGETITFTTSKGSLSGKLAIQEYQGRKYVGFKAEYPKEEGYVYGNWKGRDIRFKDTFMKHTFTEDEARQLLAGGKIVIKGVSKSDKEMVVAGGLAEQTYQGRKYVAFKPEFDTDTKNNV